METVTTDAQPSPATAGTITIDASTVQFLPFVQDALSQYTASDTGAKQGVTFATVILIAMQAVEKYSSDMAKLAGPDKLEVAKKLIPQILDLAVQNKAIDQAKADTLKAQFATGASIVEQIVEAYIIVSNNPQVIQAVEAVKTAAEGCWNNCHKPKDAPAPASKGLRLPKRHY